MRSTRRQISEIGLKRFRFNYRFTCRFQIQINKPIQIQIQIQRFKSNRDLIRKSKFLNVFFIFRVAVGAGKLKLGPVALTFRGGAGWHHPGGWNCRFWTKTGQKQKSDFETIFCWHLFSNRFRFRFRFRFNEALVRLGSRLVVFGGCGLDNWCQNRCWIDCCWNEGWG